LGEKKNGQLAKPRKWFDIDAVKAFLAFSGLLIAAIAILMALLIYQGYRDQFERAEGEAQSASRIVAVHTQWLAEASFQVLERIEDRVLTKPGWPTEGSLGDIGSELDGLPPYVGIAVYGPRGNLRLSNASEPQPINVADRDYFQALQGGEIRAISSMLIDRNSGEPAFVIARRLQANGEFAGIAAIIVSNAMLEDVWRSLDLGVQSTVSLVHSNGWVVARYPAATESVYLGDYVLFTDHLATAPQGTYLADASPVDGVSRTVAYRRIEGLPLIAVSAVSAQETLERFWRNVLIVLLLFVPIAATLLIAAVWLERIMRRERFTREALANALEKNQILFREIHHRVKNNLQAVSSLMQLQPVPPELKAEMGRRIAAMVAVHEHIYRTDQFENPEISEYVRTLIDDVSSGFGKSVRIETDIIPPVVVHRDHMMPIGLILTEALGNALKYAFDDQSEGLITVSLAAGEDRMATLRVTDNGKGFDPDQPSSGMGRKLIAGLVSQIGGKMTIRGDNGTLFMLEFATVEKKEAELSVGQ
jgi:two-component sensor histidine kinase